MKLYTVQDEHYGGLEQDRLLHIVDDSMSWINMSANGDIISNGDGGAAVDDGSMISNLPLLFANGYPTSLDKITLPELERFITFMIQCSLGQDLSGTINEPQWWPKEVKFSIPLVRPKKVNDINNWMGNLKKLVYRCYMYHRGEYLLRFCSYISQFPQNKLEFVNNWDTTTSLYIRGSERLLVTFRNENMNYDKKVESPRKSLLPPNSNIGSFGNSMKRQKQQQICPVTIVQPTDDIYLCDNCDAELVGYEQMKAHEGMCCEQEQASSRPVTPEEINQPEIKQDQFLEYFKLYSSKPPPSNNADDLNPTVNSIQLKEQLRSSRRYRGTFNLTRYSSIPFSSPAGIYLSKKSKAMTEEVQMERVDRIERYLTAPALKSSCRPKWLDRNFNWIIRSTYKINREKCSHTHEYSFKPYRRKPVLSIQSQLLYIAVNRRDACVALTRFTEEQITELKQFPARYKKYEKQIRRLVQPRIHSKISKSRTISSQLRVASNTIGNEAEPIVIDDDEDSNNNNNNNYNNESPLIRSNEVRNRMPARSANGRFVTSTHTESTNVSVNTLPTATNIIFVDLCSSDEEVPRRNTYCTRKDSPTPKSPRNSSSPSNCSFSLAYL